MTIRTKFALSAGLIVVLALTQLVVVLMLMGNQAGLARAQEVQHESWRLSNELRFSSDELTRTARTYVVTGDRAYEREYWHILAIRDGNEPRPNGRTVALRRLMEDIGFSADELGKLNEAEDNSNALVATEVAAFQAMLGRFTAQPGGTSRDLEDYTRTAPPDQAFAIRIMHDTKYHQDKDRIMGPIAESERMVVNRTLAEVERLTQRSRKLILIGAVIGLVLVAIVVLAHLLAQRPVLASTNLVRSELAELASGAADLSKRLSIRHHDELGALAAALNGLMERLEGLIRQILESGIHVNAATTKIAAGTKGLGHERGRRQCPGHLHHFGGPHPDDERRVPVVGGDGVRRGEQPAGPGDDGVGDVGDRERVQADRRAPPDDQRQGEEHRHRGHDHHPRVGADEPALAERRYRGGEGGTVRSGLQRRGA
jgi:methyl-accepting chemotaxis protein